MRQRRAAGRILFLLGTFLFFCFSPWPTSQIPVASAHSFVIGSEPVDGSTIAAAPRSIRIFFNTAISPASRAQVFDAQDRRVDLGPNLIPPGQPTELDTPLKERLDQGGYVVRWSALAQQDGHATHGIIGFNIGHSSTGLQGDPVLGPTTSNTKLELDALGLLSIIWEWLIQLALIFWIGSLTVEGFLLLPGGDTINLLNQLWKRSLPLQWLSLYALLVGEGISFFLRSVTLSHIRNQESLNLTALEQLLSQTNYGLIWLARIALLLLALFMLWRTQDPDQQRERPRLSGHKRTYVGHTWRQNNEMQLEEIQPQPETLVPRVRQGNFVLFWLLPTALLLLTYALTGQTAQLGQQHLGLLTMSWLFQTSLGIWIGELSFLGYVLLPHLPSIEPDHHADVLVSLLKRLTPLVIGAIIVLLITGLLLAETALTGVDQLIAEPFGRGLLINLVLLLALIGLSGFALLFLRPRLNTQTALLPVVDAEMPVRRSRRNAIGQSERSLRRSFVGISWLGAALLLCLAVMNFFAPPIVFPRTNYITPQQNSAPTSQEQKIGDLSADLQVLPGKINAANTLVVTLRDTNGNPVTDAQVQLGANMSIMDMGTTRGRMQESNGVYTLVLQRGEGFNMDGLWHIEIKVNRGGKEVGQGSFTVQIER